MSKSIFINAIRATNKTTVAPRRIQTRTEEKKLQKNFNPDPGKWLLCKLMVKQGYSETDVAKHMKKNETLRARKSQFG